MFIREYARLHIKIIALLLKHKSRINLFNLTVACNTLWIK